MPERQTRPLTTQELIYLASLRAFRGLKLTCGADYGGGPCGDWPDWADGRCRDGHEIEVIVPGEDPGGEKQRT